jgi:Fic family protein
VNSPLLCEVAEKERREAENAVKMLDFIAWQVERGARDVRESHVLELQRLAVEGIYHCGGKFRTARFDPRHDAEELNLGEGLRIGGSTHVPPNAASICAYLTDMLDVCNSAKYLPVERAAYALWRFNWIHPFAGGNGRVARAITYLILCMDFEAMLPGKTTMPRLIAKARERYLAALRAVDAKVALLDGDPVEANPDLNFLVPMTRFINAMLWLQLRSAGVGLTKPGD